MLRKSAGLPSGISQLSRSVITRQGSMRYCHRPSLHLQRVSSLHKESASSRIARAEPMLLWFERGINIASPMRLIARTRLDDLICYLDQPLLFGEVRFAFTNHTLCFWGGAVMLVVGQRFWRTSKQRVTCLSF